MVNIPGRNRAAPCGGQGKQNDRNQIARNTSLFCSPMSATEIAVAVILLSGPVAIGLWLVALPWMARYRRSSRWFRDAALWGGIAAVASSTAHGLLVFRPHSFDQVTAYELRTAAVLLSGLWLGFLFSLLLNAEFWEPRRPSAWRTQMLKRRQF